MKKVKIKNKKFKIIPEARIVQGEMTLKWVDNDLKTGIKPIHRFLIGVLAGELDNSGDNVYATAYCDVNDNFNEKIGIEVCSAKMEMKNHLRLVRLYDRMYKVLIDMAEIVHKWRVGHAIKAKAIDDDLCRTYGRLEI